MGILRCNRCGASTEAESVEEGRGRLDHAIGLSIGKPCGDNIAPLVFDDKTVEAPKEKPKTETPKRKPKKSPED